MSVRDYELDIQGIVNNTVYQNYLEHARHEYLKSVGIDFKSFADRGINLVVVRVELDYKFSLTSGDRFWVGVRMERESAIKLAIYEDIYRIPDNKLILKGKIIGTVLNSRGRPKIPEEIEKLI
ncbi:MAG: acyl-CoA thioesterase [Fibrobacter sp.]|nr:acyl-CoA thioesterase [Fibrobacter sp.]